LTHMYNTKNLHPGKIRKYMILCKLRIKNSLINFVSKIVV
jgi:hypothetical protein